MLVFLVVCQSDAAASCSLQSSYNHTYSSTSQPSHPPSHTSTLPRLVNQALYPYAHLPTQARSHSCFSSKKKRAIQQEIFILHTRTFTHTHAHTHTYTLGTVLVSSPYPLSPLHPTHLPHTELLQLLCLPMLCIAYCRHLRQRDKKKNSQSNSFLCLPFLLLWAIAFFVFFCSSSPFPLNLFLLSCAFIVIIFALSPCERTEK